MNRHVSTIRLILSATRPRFGPPPAIIRPFVSSTRLYATHRETVSPHSQSQATSDLLKGLGNRTGTASGTQDTVGPFPLGVGPNGRRKTWKSWSDLNIGGKRKHWTCNSNNISTEACCSGPYDATDWQPDCHPFWRRSFCCPSVCSHNGVVRKELPFCTLFPRHRYDPRIKCCTSDQYLYLTHTDDPQARFVPSATS